VIHAQTERSCLRRIRALAAGEVATSALPSTITSPGAPQWKPRTSTPSQTLPHSLYPS
jgi:hypothetical protein